MDVKLAGVWTFLWLAAGLSPLVTRSILALRFKAFQGDILGEEELAREEHRRLSFTLAGFSFAAAVAIILVEDAKDFGEAALALYLVVFSFVVLCFAADLQGYKSRRWHDQLGTALYDAGTLSLTLALVVLVTSTSWPFQFEFLIGVLALGVWTIGHGFRLLIQYQYLKAEEERRMAEKEKKPGSDRAETRDSTWVPCPIHGVRYPKGGRCPRCVDEQGG